MVTIVIRLTYLALSRSYLIQLVLLLINCDKRRCRVSVVVVGLRVSCGYQDRQCEMSLCTLSSRSTSVVFESLRKVAHNSNGGMYQRGAHSYLFIFITSYWEVLSTSLFRTSSDRLPQEKVWDPPNHPIWILCHQYSWQIWAPALYSRSSLSSGRSVSPVWNLICRLISTGAHWHFLASTCLTFADW